MTAAPASGPWCLAVLAKPHLWKLGCYLWRATWLSKSTTTQGTIARTKPKFSGALLLPDPRRQSVAALYIMIIISNFRETFANKNVTFANSNIFFARAPNITWTVFAIKTLCKDLSIDYHLYMCVCVWPKHLYMHTSSHITCWESHMPPNTAHASWQWWAPGLQDLQGLSSRGQGVGFGVFMMG